MDLDDSKELASEDVYASGDALEEDTRFEAAERG